MTARRVVLAAALGGDKPIELGNRLTAASVLGVSRQVVSLFSDSVLPKIKERKESIIKLRGAMRAEDLSEVAGKLVSNFWDVVAKPSSRMNDRVRNPNVKAEDHEKLLSNLSIDGAWELFKSWVREEDGGNQEHVPFGKEIFRRSKPYYVRNEERSVCRCIYHLRCEEFVQVVVILLLIISL